MANVKTPPEPTPCELELAAVRVELDDARSQIAELAQQLDAAQAGLLPVEGGENWIDRDGNYVTPGLLAYEDHNHQAQVEAWERETGLAADDFEAPVVSPMAEVSR